MKLLKFLNRAETYKISNGLKILILSVIVVRISVLVFKKSYSETVNLLSYVIGLLGTITYVGTVSIWVFFSSSFTLFEKIPEESDN